MKKKKLSIEDKVAKRLRKFAKVLGEAGPEAAKKAFVDLYDCLSLTDADRFAQDYEPNIIRLARLKAARQAVRGRAVPGISELKRQIGKVADDKRNP